MDKAKLPKTISDYSDANHLTGIQMARFLDGWNSGLKEAAALVKRHPADEPDELADRIHNMLFTNIKRIMCTPLPQGRESGEST